jgi:murein DD-endopeptidase MepM/ murein hydrolase activator NlpD
MGLLVVTALVLAVTVCGGLAYPVLAPDAGAEIGFANSYTPMPVETKTPTAEPTDVQPTPTEIHAQRTVEPYAGQSQIVPQSEEKHILYYTIAGDSLSVVSAHFGVDMPEIASPDPIEREGLLPPGQLLIIPDVLPEISEQTKLLPDSEVTFSPSTVDFDVEAFVNEAGGYLSTFTEDLNTTGVTTGAQIIERIALEYSVNPRLILAFLEFRSGWVYNDDVSDSSLIYPLGYENPLKEGLYMQCAWFASTVMGGYYGWREGRTLVVNFDDGQILRLAPELNAGTIGLMQAFSKLYDFDTWSDLLYGEDNFFDFFEAMFGNPWLRAQQVEPLIPADTVQPEMILPFEIGRLWAFTGGPHAAWSSADVWAALDFAPASAESGCHDTNAWVTASMPGLIVRSGNGVVVIDLDGDGYEQTGWTLLYLHIATKDRIEEGVWVEVGDRIGHPSCEGGRATGTHVHMARRYNGEWVPADGPLPFTLSGWVAKAGTEAYKGWLIKGSEVRYGSTASTWISQITRYE